MNKKGLTLIELLAVIVVLAVIALIAVPMILNIIEDARKGAAIASARSYIKATETYVVSSELDKDKISLINNNKYNVTTTTIIDGKTYQALNDLLEINGNLPIGSEDYIKINENNEVKEALLTINGYVILIRYDEVISITKGSIINVESISLDKTNESIEIGKTLQLNATVEPNNATNKIVTWSSSNESIATVDSTGVVTALKEGTVTITAKSSNSKTATADITVYKEELLSEKVQVGDYVAYDAGIWNETRGIPTIQGNFGGYTVGQNKANSVSVCQSGWGSTNLKGWRVLSVDKTTNTVTIIHAGQPECYYHACCGYANASVTNLNNRATIEYLNDTYASSSHNMNKGEADAVVAALRTTGASYWLSNIAPNPNGVYNVKEDGTFSYPGGSSNSFGIRPVVVLKPNIKTAGKTIDAVGQEAWSLVKP